MEVRLAGPLVCNSNVRGSVIFGSEVGESLLFFLLNFFRSQGHSSWCMIAAPGYSRLLR